MIRSTLHSDTGFDRHATDGHGAPIALRSEGDVEGIAAAGRVVAEALSAARAACRPGVDTAAIAAVVEEVISAAGAESTILHAVGNPLVDAEVAPFPAVACVSVEDVAIHGVPGARILANGEIASIDVAVRLDGWCADAAITVVVGEADERRRRLAKAADDLLETAIDLVRPGVRWSAVARVLQDLAIESGYGLVEGFAGHGIGRLPHEAPALPSHLTRGLLGRADFTIRPGMVLAIEPTLVEAGDLSGPAIRADGTGAGVPVAVDADGWSIRTLDGAVAAHVEHTIVVERSGARILTAANDSSNTHVAGPSGVAVLN